MSVIFPRLAIPTRKFLDSLINIEIIVIFFCFANDNIYLFLNLFVKIINFFIWLIYRKK